MALFEVPGWNMPSDVRPLPDANSKKRKRGVSEDSSSKLHTASVNLEKLMESLDRAKGSLKSKQKKKKGKAVDKAVEKNGNKQKGKGQAPLERSERDPAPSTSKQKPVLQRKGPKTGDNTLHTSNTQGNLHHALVHIQTQPDGHGSSSRSKKKKRRKSEVARVDLSPEATSRSPDDGDSGPPLTSLQSQMKQSLDGARFRWINETLYKSDSQEAERLIHENPTIFEEYHVGFRQQVTSWPTNPVDHFIKTLSSYPTRSVIVDLGCGDAALARNLVPKGYAVLSFDLFSANSFIVAADICGRLPLPGSESDDEGQVVDVVVCCLSLMNKNWLNCVREASRILKKGGELKIAEVASRFTSVDKFTSVICSIGFRLVHRDERNSHFTLFDFEKTEHPGKFEDNVWQKILTRGDVLQPCEYKKR